MPEIEQNKESESIGDQFNKLVSEFETLKKELYEIDTVISASDNTERMDSWAMHGGGVVAQAQLIESIENSINNFN